MRMTSLDGLHWRRRLSIAVLIGVCAAAWAPATPDASAAGRYRTKSIKLARGLTWKQITDRAGPNQVDVLVVTPSRRVGLDLRSAGRVLPSVKTTSRIAGRRKVYAAVNGDFRTDAGRTVHPYLRRGDLMHTGLQTGTVFALTKDRKRAFFGRPDIAMSADDGTRHKPRRIAAWNGGQPTLNRLVAFTDAGGTEEVPPTAACSARLLRSSPMAWTPDRIFREATYTVDEVGCGSAMPPAGGVVLSTLPTSLRAAWLQSLTPGQVLTLRRSLGWAGAYDGVGGMPTLLEAGVDVAPTVCNPASFCDRHPRTAVGGTDGCVDGLSRCRIFLVVVDGRRAGSVGMTFQELNALLLSLGASYAINLDGGGSTTMWVAGRGIVNRPSDGQQRRVPNGIVVTARR